MYSYLHSCVSLYFEDKKNGSLRKLLAQISHAIMANTDGARLQLNNTYILHLLALQRSAK